MTREQWETGEAHTDEALRVNNIFLTVDGETNQWHQGSWSVFIRLQGCRVGCAWCDTKHTWSIKHGELLTPGEIVSRVHTISRGCDRITLTGGEPTEQNGSALGRLLCRLLSQHFRISMETSGTTDLRPLLVAYPELNYIADFKLSSARARVEPHLESLIALRESDVVKFVAYIGDLEEVGRAAQFLRSRGSRARFVVSPVMLPGSSDDLLLRFIERMRQLDFPAQGGIGLNLQMHKFVWTENVRDEETPQQLLPLTDQQT